MNRKIYLGLLLALAFFAPTFADPPPPQIQFTNFASLSALHRGSTADLDGDGRFDVIESGYLGLFWNTGSNFVMGSRYNYASDTFPTPPLLADFDNDSDLDVFFVRVDPLSRRSTTILWNSAKRAFTNSPLVLFQPVYFGSSAAADFDNDGDLDIVMTGATNQNGGILGKNITRLYENFGAGHFAESDQSFPGLEDGATSWADYDSDGDFDLFVSGYTTAFSRAATILYRNDSGRFVDSQIVLPSLVKDSHNPVAAVWGDYDNDNDLDLLMAGSTLPNGGRQLLASIYRNDGAAFTSVPFTTNNTADFFRANWVDLDADGDLDIILSTTFSKTVFHLNNGDGTFAAAINGVGAGFHQVAFWDADTRPDLISAIYDTTIKVHRNITAATNTPPAPPSNLSVTAAAGSATFSWHPSVDSEQVGGLTYNLRVGTAPGKSDIMSAMANSTNGQRSVAGLGNTGLRTNWTLQRFSLGTYYWSVQAIDHSFVSSPFAPEQSFTISNAPPIVETRSVSNITATAAVLGTRLNPNGSPTDYFFEVVSGGFTNRHAVQGLEHISSNTIRHLLIPGLLPSTSYQVRLAASNSFGVSYSSPRAFTTAPASPLSEIATTFPVLTSNTSFLPVDLDQDGDLDLLNSGTSNSVRATWIWLNDTSLFSSAAPVQNSSAPSITSAADFNNDASMDLLLATVDSARFYLRSGTNFRGGSIISRAALHQLFPGDSDNDGDVDLLAAGATGFSGVRLHLNDNQVQFRPSPAAFGAAQLGEWGDYDHDGDHDLLLFGLTNDFQTDPRFAVTRIFRNHGANVFTNAHPELPGTRVGAAWADHDNDRDLDLLIVTGASASFSATNEVKLFRNEADGFVEAKTLFAAADIVALHIVDFNHDGRVDFVAHQDLAGGDRLRLFLNLGAENFEEQNLGLTLSAHFQAAFADFDGDLLPDLFLNTTTNRSQFRLRLFRNNLVSSEPLPPVPINLASAVAKTYATVQWELPAAPDAASSTNSVAYTFNLRVGKTPGGSEIMSAMSHPVTGACYLSQRGNAGQGNTWTIRDLPPGTYYWSVQSVDHAFGASPFAPEASFNIAHYERPARITVQALSPHLEHRLTIDGPIRTSVILESSVDFETWETSFNHTYIGAEPVTITTGASDTRFYRFELLD